MKTQIENFKMKVTPEQSKRVQEVCFENGVTWPGNDIAIDVSKPMLYLTGFRLTHNSDMEVFNEDERPELTYAEFIAKYAPENQPAPPRINPSHLAAALRIFGPYTDSENIAKIVNIVLDRPELFRELAELDEKINHPKN